MIKIETNKPILIICGCNYNIDIALRIFMVEGEIIACFIE